MTKVNPSAAARLGYQAALSKYVSFECDVTMWENVYTERINEEKQKSQLDERSSAKARNKNLLVKTKERVTPSVNPACLRLVQPLVVFLPPTFWSYCGFCCGSSSHLAPRPFFLVQLFISCLCK